MTLHFPGRAPSPIDPDRAPGAASLLEAIEQTGTPPPSPVAAAIIAEKALSEQSGVLSRIIPAPVLREAVEITRETVLGVGAATHMPDPDADRRALDGTLKELRSSYAAQEDTAGAQPTDLGDATSDNPLLRIGGTIGVVRELQRDLPTYASRKVPRPPLGSRLVVRAALSLQARRAPDTVSRAEAADIIANKSLRGVWPRPRTLVALGMITRLLR